MEKSIETCLAETCSKDGVVGSIMSDQQGLCLGVKGRASIESSGVVTAIADQAAKLEPNSQNPIIVLENDTNQCLIQRAERATIAIYKTSNLAN
ncbi:ragulator complex protein LAMTOR5 [Frankliniella occidentalis]|uniref:Late endosomal/lysosomal adaptor and MAPK and MTOR activator 5 n=1 Tax=Frankliniella occidentalis TaxID=133901 RepID=A0A6J1T4J3_FRAOC|nr:ragulator complex protein LAMTOR5 [Frankliniella occidentalis]